MIVVSLATKAFAKPGATTLATLLRRIDLLKADRP